MFSETYLKFILLTTTTEVTNFRGIRLCDSTIFTREFRRIICEV